MHLDVRPECHSKHGFLALHKRIPLNEWTRSGDDHRWVRREPPVGQAVGATGAAALAALAALMSRRSSLGSENSRSSSAVTTSSAAG
jgi:hypothetical protein